MLLTDLLHSVLLRYALAAFCGIRAFLPLCVLSAATVLLHYHLPEPFAFLGNPIALALLCALALVEEVLQHSTLARMLHPVQFIVLLCCSLIVQGSASADPLQWSMIAAFVMSGVASAVVLHFAWSVIALQYTTLGSPWRLVPLLFMASCASLALPYLSAAFTLIIVVWAVGYLFTKLHHHF